MICLSDYEEHANELVSLAFEICELIIKSTDGNENEKIKSLCAAAESLEKSIAIFVMLERIHARI